MDEQSRTDPPRDGRKQTKATPRSRPAKAAFTPPPMPTQQTEQRDPARKPVAKVAPAVLFQPPTAEEKPSVRRADTPAAPSPITPEIADSPGTTPAAAKKAAPGKETSLGRKATPTKKAAPVDRATPAKKAATKAATKKAAAKAAAEQFTPVREATAAPAGQNDQAVRRTEAVAEPTITARLLDHPGHAPELLALAAVDVLGPYAQDWADRFRANYPAATAAGLARLATRRFVRLAGAGGAASAAAGLFAPLAGLSALAWTQAGLVLHLAAAHGQDPTHPDRAVDLLVLTRVHATDETARAALAAAQGPTSAADQSLAHLAESARRLATPFAAQAGGWLSARLASRLLPGVALLAAGAGGSAAAQRLAARAVARYKSKPESVTAS